jgi:hypothetical protein
MSRVIIAASAIVFLIAGFGAWLFAAPTAEIKLVTVQSNKIGSFIGRKFNPKNEVAVGGYNAIYLNDLNPDSIVFQELVLTAAISYPFSEFHGIGSENFSAYWVGLLKFESTTSKEFNISQSWARSRIYVDGKAIYDKANAKETFTYTFSPGEHVIEIEHANNWHTVEFKFTMSDASPTFDQASISKYLKGLGLEKPQVFYTDVYESADKDVSINVNVPSTSEPVVLWLNSYEAIDWNVDAGKNLAAVIMSSYSPGSRVIGVDANKVVRFHKQVRTNLSSACKGQISLFSLASTVRNLTSFDLGGYAIAYRSKDLRLRKDPVPSEEKMAELAREGKEVKDKCLEKST